MSSSKHLSFQSYARFSLFEFGDLGPSRKILNYLSALNISLSSFDSFILSVPNPLDLSSSQAIGVP